ncbi:MAG: hypothetical protein SOY54_03305 [Bacilli bacterium]|nr:hypothetical protein [Bacilli bacterium]
MKKVCVLFGAGADANYGICNGLNFALKVVGFKTDKMNEAIIKFYSEKKKNSKYPNWCNDIDSHDLFNDKEESDEEKSLIEKSLRKKYLTEYLQSGNDSSKTAFDSEIKNILENLDQTEKKALLDNYISYMGVLDEKFSTLIFPKYLGPQKFWKVVKCYTRAYLTIVFNLLNEETEEETVEKYYEYLKKPKETLERIKEKYKKLNQEKQLNKQANGSQNVTYYETLKKYLNNIQINVVTTNYTPICEITTNINENNIAYVHGKIGLFEAPYSLKVFDVEKEELPNEIYFPYLFIQSGVKPVVEYNQIKEYYKMVKFFEEAERLIIVGYKINIDDHHINGLIRNLFQDKEIVYLDYDSFDKEYICKLLRLPEKNYKNLKYVSINESNSVKIFEEILTNDIIKIK